ncbi:MAG: family 43 glycosylhydrolase [Bacilli bacterium]|nr:family 43 glycosylhydrolase [Bacilli bacterium]
MKKFIFIMPLMAISLLASCGEKTPAFTVTWKNYDGSILEIDENVRKGTIPSYDGLIPTREHDSEFIYHFKKWDNDISEPITKDTIFAAEYDSEKIDLEYQLQDDNTYMVSGIGTYVSSNLIIPSSYNNLPVTKIKDGAFKNNTTISSLTIMPNLKEIGIKSFYACTNLRSVTLADTVTKISTSAFEDCTSLAFVDMSMFDRCIGGDMCMFDNCAFTEGQSIKFKDQLVYEMYQDHAFFEYYAEYMYYVDLKIGDNCQIVLGEDTVDRCQDAHQINDALTYIGQTPLEIVDGQASMITSEIILDSAREESQKLLATITDSDGYAIKVEDKKVVIAAKTKLARTCAVDRLLTDYLKDDGLYIPKDLDVKGSCPKGNIITEITLPEDTPGTLRTIRDPFIFRDGSDYYMYGTTEWDGIEWRVYKANGSFKNEWTLVNHSIIDKKYDDIDKQRWAPEVHEYNGKYYMFTTYLSKTTNKRGVTVFESDSLTEGFTMISRNEGNTVKPGHITNDSIMGSTIDGSLYVDQSGQPWMVYVDEWVDNVGEVGAMDIVKLNDGLSTIDESTNVELFNAKSSGWTEDKVTDGCFIHRMKDGRLTMIWSNGDTKGKYAVGLLTNKGGEAKINDPTSWLHQNRTLYTEGIYDGAPDGGHGMIFTDINGQMYLCIHASNGSDAHPVIIPIKEAYGTLVWDLYNNSVDLN